MNRNLMIAYLISIMLIAGISSSFAANNFFDDKPPPAEKKSDKTSDDFFSDSDGSIDTDGMLEEVKRVQIEQNLKQVEKKKQRKIKEMNELCSSNTGLVFTSRRKGDLNRPYASYSTPRECRKRYREFSVSEYMADHGMHSSNVRKGGWTILRNTVDDFNDDQHRNKKKCIAWVKQKKQKKELCRKWRNNYKNGVIQNSELENEIKTLNLDIQAAYLAEQQAKKKLKQTQANERMKQNWDEESKKKNKAFQAQLERNKRYKKRLAICEVYWGKRNNPCSCSNFNKEDIPVWVLNAKTCGV